MKKTIRRIVLILAVIISMVSLTCCESYAEVGTQVANDDDTIVISIDKDLKEIDMEVTVIPTAKVILGGNTIGIKFYSKGVLVTATSPVQGIDGEWYEPYKNTSIKKGAKILKINNERVETILELTEAISNGEKDKKIIVQYEQDGKIYEEEMEAIESLDDGRKKLGLWVRDVGVTELGTLTFYDTTSGKIAALGHRVLSLKELIYIDYGIVNLASVVSIKKGVENEPGEIKGVLNEGVKIGNIELHNDCGIYGEYDETCTLLKDKREVLVASKNEIKVGPAKIYCSVESDGIPREYDIEIKRISKKTGDKTKEMRIRVTDPELLNKTGGLIRGMSGSPIVQDGKFIGAVTRVDINDPTLGYAIYAETMLEQINKLNKSGG